MESSTPVHYAPDGATPLCGEECPDVVVDVLPEMVKHCGECLELIAEDLADNNKYRGHCLHCR